MSWREDGLRVDVEETTERVSRSRSRRPAARVDSLGRRRRASSRSRDEAEEPLSLLPVNRLHMARGRWEGAMGWRWAGDGRWTVVVVVAVVVAVAVVVVLGRMHATVLHVQPLSKTLAVGGRVCYLVTTYCTLYTEASSRRAPVPV